MRRIIHIDMDCFYAAVEMRERPELAKRPIAVGGSGGRGVLTTCNYIAREYGLRSAMPAFKARELCPEVVLLPVRFDLYKEVSAQIQAIFKRYTPLVEPLSLDEAYLDVTHLRRPGAEVAQEIRETIFRETQLTTSAGIAPNKLLAKIASDWRKPNGQFSIPPSAVADFVRTLPVRKLWGIGPKSAERMAGLGIHTCADLQTYEQHELARLFGSFGLELYHLCRGQDDRPVSPNRIRKSQSNERTYDRQLESLADCETALREQFDELVESLRDDATRLRPIGKLVVKLKFSDFNRTTVETKGQQAHWPTYRRLLRDAWGRSGDSVRLVGIGVRFADLDQRPEQLELALFDGNRSNP